MIKKVIPVLFLFPVCNSLFAQSLFTKFVEDKKIQWAAASADTFHFIQPDLSLILRERFDKGEIKVALLENIEGLNKITYSSKESILNRIAPNREKPVTGENGNIISTVREADNPLVSSKYFDERSRNLLEIQQVFYIEDGLLKNITNAVSPKYSVKTSWGETLGISNAFTTSFNDKRTIKRSVKRKAILLGTTNTFCLLKNAPFKMLKQLYEQNILDALWPQLGKKGYEITRIDSSKKISVKDINISLLGNTETINVPVYDANGNIQNTLAALPLLTPASFTAIGITQQWYYSKEKNIVFCSISSLTLYALKDAIETPVVKINLK